MSWYWIDQTDRESREKGSESSPFRQRDPRAGGLPRFRAKSGAGGRRQAHHIEHQLALAGGEDPIAPARVRCALLRVNVEDGAYIDLCRHPARGAGRAVSCGAVWWEKQRKVASYVSSAPVFERAVQLGGVLEGLVSDEHIPLEREAELAALVEEGRGTAQNADGGTAKMRECPAQAHLDERGIRLGVLLVVPICKPAVCGAKTHAFKCDNTRNR